MAHICTHKISLTQLAGKFHHNNPIHKILTLAEPSRRSDLWFPRKKSVYKIIFCSTYIFWKDSPPNNELIQSHFLLISQAQRHFSFLSNTENVKSHVNCRYKHLKTFFLRCLWIIFHFLKEPNILVGEINSGPSVDGKFSRLSAVSCMAVEAESYGSKL